MAFLGVGMDFFWNCTLHVAYNSNCSFKKSSTIFPLEFGCIFKKNIQVNELSNNNNQPRIQLKANKQLYKQFY